MSSAQSNASAANSRLPSFRRIGQANRPPSRPTSLYFVQNRLTSRAGWRELPAVHAGLPFPLFGLSSMFSRIIAVGARVFEIWSPNSTQSPYYPGVPREAFDPLATLPPRSRRNDGSLGRFDPTVAPQLFQPNAPYWGFIRRAELVDPWNHFYRMYAPIVSFWRDAEARRDNRALGLLAHDFVVGLAELGEEVRTQGDALFAELPVSWQTSFFRPPPVLNYAREISTLRSPILYQDALDIVTQLQRVFRIRRAWMEWIKEVRRPTGNVLLLRRMITAAEDKYMGFWLNGGDERWSLTLMHLKVPGFVLHEYMPGENNIPTSSLSDFWDDSIEASVVLEYDGVGGSQASMSPILLDDRGSAPPLRGDELWMSSSWFAQGPRVPGTPLPEVIVPSLPPSTAAAPEPPTLPAIPEDDFSDYGERSPIAPQATEGTAWIPPPDIQAAPLKGAWEKWRYDDDREVYVLVGKKNKGSPGKAYYDRVLRRKIYIVALEIPDGVWDVRNFGLPVPEGDFVIKPEDRWVKGKRSQWMYLEESPSDAMPAGTSASLPQPSVSASSVSIPCPEPTAEAGPSLASTLSANPLRVARVEDSSPAVLASEAVVEEAEPAEPSTSNKGKGKTKATEEDVEMTDLTGEGASGPEVLPSESRSTVVVLDGLHHNLDIHDYIAAISEDLYQQGLVLFSAMNGQRRIWLQFFDLEAAERALTVLPTAGGSRDVIARFATLNEYEELWPYAASQWDRARSPSPPFPLVVPPRPIVEPEDDMVSLGDTPPPDDCLMLEHCPKDLTRSSLPFETKVGYVPDVIILEAPLKDKNSDVPVPESKRLPEPDTNPSRRSVSSTSEARTDRREIPRLQDALDWGSSPSPGGRRWLDQMLYLSMRPSLEGRLSALISPPALQGRLRSETSTNQESGSGIVSQPSLVSRMEIPGPSSSRTLLQNRMSDPNSREARHALRNRMDGALRARISRRATVPSSSKTRKTKRGKAGGAQNRKRETTARRRRLEDAIIAASGAVARRLWVIYAMGGSRILPPPIPPPPGPNWNSMASISAPEYAQGDQETDEDTEYENDDMDI